MGVWIETFCVCLNNRQQDVTPCMGVWIETSMQSHLCGCNRRHTLYGCVD